MLIVAAAACGGGPAASPAPLPEVPAPRAEPAPVRERRVALPMSLQGTTWRVSSRIELEVSDSSGSAASGASVGRGSAAPAVIGRQQVESNGLVTWSGTRAENGALTMRGQVDSFTVRTTFDDKLAPPPVMPAMMLIEGRLDSTTARVVPRPVLENECDRPEAAAAAIAAELLVRIPEGATEGSSWRDSSATIVCRSGVPMTLLSTSQTTLESLGDLIRLRRVVTQRVSGTGGSPFRSFEVRGEGTSSQRIEVNATTGVVQSLEGTGALTLTTTERTPQMPPRVMVAEQRGELRAQVMQSRQEFFRE